MVVGSRTICACLALVWISFLGTGAVAQSQSPIAAVIKSLGEATQFVAGTNDSLEKKTPKALSKSEDERLRWYVTELKTLLFDIGKLRLPNSGVRDALRSQLTEPTESGWLRARYTFNQTLKIVLALKERLKAFDDPDLNEIVTGIALREDILNALVAMPLPTSESEIRQLGDLYIAYDRLARELLRQNDLLSKYLKVGRFG